MMDTNLNQPNDSRLVVGLFHERDELEAAIADLRSAGFGNEQIGVIARDEGNWSTNDAELESEASDTFSGAAAGAATGAGIGGLWALGIAAGVLPAIGPVVAGGILGSILASATAGAAVGAVAGGLIGLGMSEEDAQFVEDEVASGRIVVTVRPGERQEQVKTILRANGAYEVRTTQPTMPSGTRLTD
jgi:hypothetical protein